MAGSSKGPIYAAIAANVGIAIAKFIAAGISGSSAMLSEGIHSLVDTGNGFLLLFGIRQSKKPANEQYPLGRGKEVYFWSLVVAVLIFAVGGGMSFYEGIAHLQHPEPIGDPTLSYIVLLVSILFEGSALYLAVKSFNKRRRLRAQRQSFWRSIIQSKDPTAFAVIFEDSAALLGLLIALLGVYLGHTFNEPLYDGLASIFIGVILTVIAVLLAAESKALLIGESAFLEVRQGIRKICEEDEATQFFNSPITVHFGPEEVLVALDVEFKDSLSSDGIEQAVNRIEQKIRAQFPVVKRIFIEAKAVSKIPKKQEGQSRPPGENG